MMRSQRRGTEDLTPHAWSADSWAAALEALLAAAGIMGSTGEPPANGTAPDCSDLRELIEWKAKRLGCEAHPIETTFGDLEKNGASLCPALLRIGLSAWLAVLRVRGDQAELVLENNRRKGVSWHAVCRAVRSSTGAENCDELADLLDAAGFAQRNRKETLGLLLDQQYRDRPCRAGWSVRSAYTKPGLLPFLRRSGALRNGGLLIAAHGAQYLLWLMSWWILGQLSFEGHMDTGWLLAWGLLLLTLVPLRVFTTYAQGVLAIGVGAALKRHLLLGALRLTPDEVRLKGIGNVLGQVFESEAVESLALGGGVAGCLALLELFVAGFVLGPLSILLVACCALAAVLSWRFWLRYQRWTSTRMSMTEHLIESMVGQRTRLAQQSVAEWHSAEDQALESYLARSGDVDWNGTWLVAAIPRGWLISALICLAPSAIGGMQSTSTLAIRLGGVLLAFTALQKLTGAAVDIAATIVAAMRMAPLFQAAQRAEIVGAVPPCAERSADDSGSKVVEVDRLTFRYGAASKTALQASNLTVRDGERILLEGPSGGGKSTLAALIAGMRRPVSGLVLAGGLDRFTLGEQGWRKRVATAPQFHENHILTETLAFNLLMGRNWPPLRSDLEEAETICRELGLGDLLDRMPSGLMQMVGEGGWQLSHGERSRVFLARALLQNADLTILDESFGALDPESLRTSLDCTFQRTNALMVIAHP